MNRAVVRVKADMRHAKREFVRIEFKSMAEAIRMEIHAIKLEMKAA
jgi:hypothetical protein